MMEYLLENGRGRQVWLFIVDVIMPGINGLSLQETEADEPVVPVIILTALGTTDDKLSGFEAVQTTTL